MSIFGHTIDGLANGLIATSPNRKMEAMEEAMPLAFSVINSIPRPHRLVLLDPHLHIIICLPIYRLICGNELSENHKHRISEITFNI